MSRLQQPNEDSFSQKHQTIAQRLLGNVCSDNLFISFEVNPPLTPSLKEMLAAVHNQAMPLFWSVSCHLKQSDHENYSKSLDLAAFFVQELGSEAVLHLPAVTLTKPQVEKILNEAKVAGIKNILALRGDSVGVEDETFSHAFQLVEFIRMKFGSDFCIAVAGYPSKHPEASNYETDIQHLKRKVDAGADFIISQIFFKSDDFIKFVLECRKMGISVPIVPGIFIIENHKSFNLMQARCCINIPTEVKEAVTAYKDDIISFRKFGIQMALNIIKELQTSGLAECIHLFTHSRMESILELLSHLNFKKMTSSIGKI